MLDELFTQGFVKWRPVWPMVIFSGLVDGLIFSNAPPLAGSPFIVHEREIFQKFEKIVQFENNLISDSRNPRIRGCNVPKLRKNSIQNLFQWCTYRRRILKRLKCKNSFYETLSLNTYLLRLRERGIYRGNNSCNVTTFSLTHVSTVIAYTYYSVSSRITLFVASGAFL